MATSWWQCLPAEVPHGGGDIRCDADIADDIAGAVFADHQLDLSCLVHFLAACLHAIFGGEGLCGVDDLAGHRINGDRFFLLRGVDERIEIKGVLRVGSTAKHQREDEGKG